MNVIAALGATFGRRYASPMDTRTNIYIVGLAGTASGKDHSRRCIKRIMNTAGLSEFLGGDSIPSGQGLVTALHLRPSQVLLLDEFGMLMEAITDKKGAHHMKVAAKIITELYSHSGVRYSAGQYADPKVKPVSVECPNLCLYGTSTIEKYASALNSDTILSGELNRFIVVRAAQDMPTRRRGVVHEAIPEWLVTAWSSFKPTGLAQQNLSITCADPILVTWDGFQDRIDDMGDFEDQKLIENKSGVGPLWNRYRENVIKVAMIFAIARNSMTPKITAYDLDMAEAIVSSSVDFMCTLAHDYMHDNELHKTTQTVLRHIRNNSPIAHKELLRKFQTVGAKALNDIIIRLDAQGDIEIRKTNEHNPGRPGSVYVSLQ